MAAQGHQAKSMGAGVKPAFPGRLRYQTFVGLPAGLARCSSSLEIKGDDHVLTERTDHGFEPEVESTVRYLGVEVDDALTIAEQVDV